MFQDSAGTTPVTAAGQPVGRILDKSGRGNHRTQGTAASRPTLQQDASGYYLQYDGVDDWMQTGSVDFSGTDKVTVLAGVRKDTDAARAILLIQENAGIQRIAIEAPNATLGNFVAVSGGSINVSTAVAAAAPNSSVLALQGDIGGDSLILRRNGVVGSQTSADQGTGNYSNSPFFFGRTGGGTLPFTGREYQTIILGRSANATEIARAERFVGQRMGISL